MTVALIDIVCDPNGVYVGRDRRGWLWYYSPGHKNWFVLLTGENDDPEGLN